MKNNASQNSDLDLEANELDMLEVKIQVAKILLVLKRATSWVFHET